jgi:hypothetical protein
MTRRRRLEKKDDEKKMTRVRVFCPRNDFNGGRMRTRGCLGEATIEWLPQTQFRPNLSHFWRAGRPQEGRKKGLGTDHSLWYYFVAFDALVSPLER